MGKQAQMNNQNFKNWSTENIILLYVKKEKAKQDLMGKKNLSPHICKNICHLTYQSSEEVRAG